MRSLAILQSLRKVLTANVKAVLRTLRCSREDPSYRLPKSLRATGVGQVLVAKAAIAAGTRAIPVGVVEISDQQARFVPFTDQRKLAGAAIMGIGLGSYRDA